MTPSQQFFFQKTNFTWNISGVICETCHMLRNLLNWWHWETGWKKAERCLQRRNRLLLNYRTTWRCFLCYFIDFFSLFSSLVHFLFQGDSQAGVHASLPSTGMFAIDCRRRVSSPRWIMKRLGNFPSKACSIDSKDNRVCVHLIYRLAKKRLGWNSLSSVQCQESNK